MSQTGTTRTLTWIAHIHSLTYINTVTTTVYEAPAHLSLIWNQFFILKVPEGGGANRSTRRKKTNSLPTNIRGENPTSRMGIEPSPSSIGDKLAWPRECAASDPQSYMLS